LIAFTLSKSLFKNSSTRKIKRGYFSILVNICSLLSASNNTYVKEQLADTEWLRFYDENISPYVKLYQKRLCHQEEELENSFANSEGIKLASEETSSSDDHENPFEMAMRESVMSPLDDNNANCVFSKAECDAFEKDELMSHSHLGDYSKLDNFMDSNYWKIDLKTEDFEKVLQELDP
jgi:hypothetical protein